MVQPVQIHISPIAVVYNKVYVYPTDINMYAWPINSLRIWEDVKWVIRPLRSCIELVSDLRHSCFSVFLTYWIISDPKNFKSSCAVTWCSSGKAHSASSCLPSFRILLQTKRCKDMLFTPFACIDLNISLMFLFYRCTPLFACVSITFSSFWVSSPCFEAWFDARAA